MTHSPTRVVDGVALHLSPSPLLPLSLTSILVLVITHFALGQDNTDAPVNQKAIPLFDGTSLAGWKVTNFGGEGEVSVEKGLIKMEPGYPLTGITYVREVPTQNYEIHLEAKRVDGNDFFCGLTFPVAQSHCSLILGGWGGTVTGLSSINGADASENGTTKYISYKNDKWYKVRLRVTDKVIQAWLDDKRIVDQPTGEVEISTRIEVNRSKPLGISAFETRSWLRNLKLIKLAVE